MGHRGTNLILRSKTESVAPKNTSGKKGGERESAGLRKFGPENSYRMFLPLRKERVRRRLKNQKEGGSQSSRGDTKGGRGPFKRLKVRRYRCAGHVQGL